MRTERVVGPSVLLVFLALAIPPSAAVEIPDIQGDSPPQGGGSGNGDPDPGGPAVDPDKVLDDAGNLVGDENPGGGYAPAPPGTDRGVDRIGDEIGSVIAENWLLSAGIAAALVGSSIAGWFLASRYVDPKVALANPQRSMLYGFVKGNPGVHLKQLSSEFQMKTSTVLWHVRKLESAELVRSKKSNGYRVFYPVSGGLEASQVSEAVTALSNANARRIYAHFADSPVVDLRSLPGTLAINAGTVRWHLKKLVKAGLLEESVEPGANVLRVTELGLKALRQLQGTATPIEVATVVPPSEAQAAEEPFVYQ